MPKGRGGFGCGRGGCGYGFTMMNMEDVGIQQKRISLGIWRRWKRREKKAAVGWSPVRYCTFLSILLAPFSLFPLCDGVISVRENGGLHKCLMG